MSFEPKDSDPTPLRRDEAKADAGYSLCGRKGERESSPPGYEDGDDDF